MNLSIQSSPLLLPQSRNIQSSPHKHIKKIPPLFVNNSPNPLLTDFFSFRIWVNRSRTLRQSITLPESSHRKDQYPKTNTAHVQKQGFPFVFTGKLTTRCGRADPAQLSLKMLDSVDQTRGPLSQVVSDCVKRWFQETLKEAEAGDAEMQLLLGQMYNSGYGVNKDTETGRAWITEAAKSMSSAFKSSNKQPGYNASDSDSEDLKDSRS